MNNYSGSVKKVTTFRVQEGINMLRKIFITFAKFKPQLLDYYHCKCHNWNDEHLQIVIFNMNIKFYIFCAALFCVNVNRKYMCHLSVSPPKCNLK